MKSTGWIFFSCSNEDIRQAQSIALIFERHGFECKIPAFDNQGDESRAELLEGASALLVILSAEDGNSVIRRDLEYGDNLDIPVYPVRLSDIKPSGFLRYYVGPHQWIDLFGPGRKDALEKLLDLLSSSGEATDIAGDSTSGRTLPGRFTSVYLILVILACLVLVLLLNWFPFSVSMDIPVLPDSCDCLLVTTEAEGSTGRYLSSLGYSVFAQDSYPVLKDMLKFDFVVILNYPTDGSDALLLYDYIGSGGSLMLTAGHPYYLGMPEWIGMETYDNYWGSGFPFTVTYDRPAGAESLAKGDTLAYFHSYMDGGAVLMHPLTASIDACYAGEDSLAAFIRNRVGPGRVAWVTMCVPFTGNEGYSTGSLEIYLEALYAWLDGDGPGR